MSKIEVDAIDKQSGSTVTIGGSGTNVVLGTCGQTVSLGTGASQSGFGRTGTVDWQTGSIKTATFTAANGEGYFANTSGGAFTMNLPAGTAGNIVSVVDYTNTFQTHSLTIAPNGSQKIGGVAAPLGLITEGQSVTFVYVDDTEGWKNVQDSTTNATGNAFVTATGGTITTCGNFKIHTFTGPGTFTVSNAGQPCGSNTVDYLVLAGGGSGGVESDSSTSSGGGGAGGYRFSNGTASGCYSAGPSPLGASALPVPAQAYPITVGAGGVASQPEGHGVPGSNSIFSSITSTGGGGGGGWDSAPDQFEGQPGGSGGGGKQGTPGGAGNTPPVSPPQGNDGGTSSGVTFPSAGGGGAGAAGTAAGPSQSGAGGAGLASSITGSAVTRGGGGGGGGVTNRPQNSPPAAGGSGGGGAGGAGNTNNAVAGTVNTGGGGGGAGNAYPSYTYKAGGSGGSGIVIIRYKFQ